MVGFQLSYQDLLILKEEYPYHKIIYISYGENEFVFRSLTRKEYKDILAIASDEYEMQELITQSAMIIPTEFDMMESFAGLPKFVSERILEYSNFSNARDILQIYEAEKISVQSQFDKQCVAVIKAAMPEYAVTEIEDWTYEKIMRMTALAEHILNLRLPKADAITLTSNLDEYEKEQEERKDPSEDPEIIWKIRESGLDPMFYFGYDPIKKRSLVDFPLIGGRHWRNEGVLNAIRKQIQQRQD